MASFHRYTDLSLIVAFLGAFGLLVNQRHLLLSVLCIERRFYGLNLFLVALAVRLDDRLGELFALFVLTLAAAESALALALLRAYFRVYGNILLREGLTLLKLMPLSVRLAALLPSARVVASSNSVIGETRVAVPAAHLLQTLTLLRRHTGREFSQLIAITAIDNPERNRRFEVVYLLLSPSTGQRLSVSVHVSEGTPLPSATRVYSSAGWYERETWDRFGILFTGHPDLRRRLTDYGFKGHPLRKDFPVTGYVEVRYDDVRKRILYEGVSLAQEFRLFTLDQPWS